MYQVIGTVCAPYSSADSRSWKDKGTSSSGKLWKYPSALQCLSPGARRSSWPQPSSTNPCILQPGKIILGFSASEISFLKSRKFPYTHGQISVCMKLGEPSFPSEEQINQIITFKLQICSIWALLGTLLAFNRLELDTMSPFMNSTERFFLEN